MRSMIDYVILGVVIMFALVMAGTGIAVLSIDDFPSNLIQSAGFFITAVLILWLYYGFTKEEKK